MDSLVSVIMPVYNAELFLREAIQSVINQTYVNWELIIINDGSTDQSCAIAESYEDERIHIYSRENQGVSSARNHGIKHMNGEYFCFLDADDTFSTHSLESRLQVFHTSDKISFVDGAVNIYDNNTGTTIRRYKPKFKGNCVDKLLALSEDCFVGQTWMVKRNEGFDYSFPKDQKHSEDITFFLEIANQGLYSYTEEIILNYRTGHGSAMNNLKGLELGYFQYLKKAKELFPQKRFKLFVLRLKIIKIMVLSYLALGMKLDAFKVLRKII